MVFNILHKADELINIQRKQEYGDATKEFTKVAQGWSGILGVEVKAKHVAACMAYLKIIRDIHWHKQDNLIDCAGYIGLMEKVQQERLNNHELGNKLDRRA